MARLRPQDAERRRAAGPDFLEALARGLAVLQAFGPERRQMTLAEVARVVDLPRATARRALLTLAQLGHLETDGRLFRLTPRVLRLAAGYLGGNGASTILQPRCERLSLAIGEPCSAAVLDGEEIVFIAYGQPTPMLNVTTIVGWRLPAFCTALGRVLLAGLPDAELEAFLARLRPEPVTRLTELDPAAIRAQVLETRAQGFALVDQEAEIGFRSLAVPLRRYDGRVVAALNLGMHTERGSAVILHERVLPLLRAEAEEISAQLV
ncbi:IclR family transcriptional regulator [Humitalea rosea]|uniref:IclR family transcriptional regulator n=1 Tax=Humitalea rosea TaxID=990373 RepID=A0A2W7J1B7_9PROT|nr:IclR family transcriptional regulator C-terminal domain-containing protein [Humitalea rosea]PZW44763.1 IclR family transcriptional regulator [Humitalea rosea]